MLTNEKTGNARTVTAVPTASGNGFTAGRAYVFTHHINGLYRTVNDNGHERFEDFGATSAHLWDGANWLAAGHFEIKEITP